MTTREIVQLMLKSSNTNPYCGKLSMNDNISSAIELTLLAKTFADNGQRDEAMNIESGQYSEVINELKTMIRIKKFKKILKKI